MEKFARKDSVTGKGMNEGFCFGDGLFYCESDEHALEHAKSLGFKSLKESYKAGAHYWTEWYQDIEDEANLEQWYDADGNEYRKCHKCKEETSVDEDFYFCKHCLTHL